MKLGSLQPNVLRAEAGGSMVPRRFPYIFPLHLFYLPGWVAQAICTHLLPVVSH